ncbi:hypothetical protein [Zhihengliuella salsuginis]|uniref:Ribosomal protein L7/L12 C-terminal domain-containing protein n=1 Tax=Zhihengliuella salsuginis TaxID=578222 RepID=A0ABQ3GMM5_9MICC|nr:hypothetical protein [Zhihengliuella salsuginis]GHD12313.1 hypothetical protein GCM10008096_27500 [Zhihengliuella salsuginis]
MFGITVVEAIIFLAVVGIVVGVLWAIFVSRPKTAVSVEEQYIERLNAQWAKQRHEETQKAERIRRETEQRLPTSGSTPIATVSDPTASAGPSMMNPSGTARGAAEADPDYQAVLALVQQGKVVQAVRKVRQDTGIGLADAKKFIDQMAGRR